MGRSPTTVAITVLLVDDHDAFRSAARAELEAGGMEVVAELGRAAGAVERTAALRPDVALLDIRLPDGDGVDLARQIQGAAPQTKVVVTSGMNAEDAEERLAAAGSTAPFLPKSRLTAHALREAVG
jgi:DNA-binding NarL/FixJ family response regulator